MGLVSSGGLVSCRFPLLRKRPRYALCLRLSSDSLGFLLLAIPCLKYRPSNGLSNLFRHNRVIPHLLHFDVQVRCSLHFRTELFLVSYFTEPGYARRCLTARSGSLPAFSPIAERILLSFSLNRLKITPCPFLGVRGTQHTPHLRLSSFPTPRSVFNQIPIGLLWHVGGLFSPFLITTASLPIGVLVPYPSPPVLDAVLRSVIFSSILLSRSCSSPSSFGFPWERTFHQFLPTPQPEFARGGAI